jgi:hypothetical protein
MLNIIKISKTYNQVRKITILLSLKNNKEKNKLLKAVYRGKKCPVKKTIWTNNENKFLGFSKATQRIWLFFIFFEFRLISKN